MAEITGIEWATSTFNPWWGCARVSRACNGCYAESLAGRFGLGWGKTAERRFFGDKHWNEPLRWNRKAAATGQQWRVFCASMADVFEDREDLVPHRERLWSLVAATPALTWMFLTKRPENVLGMVPWAPGRWPRNVWLGVTAEDQENADKRLPILLGIPAWTRFLSCEPLAGPLDLAPYVPAAAYPTGWDRTTTAVRTLSAEWQVRRRETGGHGIDWIITGGESGRQAKPSDVAWFRGLRDLALDRGVPFFFKQWGEYVPVDQMTEDAFRDWDALHGGDAYDRSQPWRIGKRRAGALLDETEWKQIPTSLPLEVHA